MNCCFVWFLPYTYTCKLYAAYYYLLPGYFRLIEGSKNLVSWVGPEMPRAAWSWLHALMIQKMIQKRAINDQAVVVDGEVHTQQFIYASYLEHLYWLGVRHRSTYLSKCMKLKNSNIFFGEIWFLSKGKIEDETLKFSYSINLLKILPMMRLYAFICICLICCWIFIWPGLCYSSTCAGAGGWSSNIDYLWWYDWCFFGLLTFNMEILFNLRSEFEAKLWLQQPWWQ